MSDQSVHPIVMIGGGGHASVLMEILLQQGREVLAVVSPEDISQRAVFSGITHLKDDDDVLSFPNDQVRLVNGVGMMPKSGLKRKINEYFLSLGYQFETVISSSALVSPYSKIEVGAQILPMSIVQTGVKIGPYCIVNTGALIEHDCNVGAYNHIAPRATLCGEVVTEENAYIGAGATVIQGLSIGQGSVVGSGVNLSKSLAANTTAYPARALIRKNL
ncbi:acetyltransferase [Vibrio methylphosphonaticus]|uniref:acetyltransferase n=1 Tax=Vibrio methylphosphonaticus TaxID=2946866 RepID=UPI00202A489F|nr:acetyltransferase [Vibrio methylphosphonaticus]MCL9775533.1 acetyltransferase [Vibrio methylphosphonaticus]